MEVEGNSMGDEEDIVLLEVARDSDIFIEQAIKEGTGKKLTNSQFRAYMKEKTTQRQKDMVISL
eukprot:scaffold7550_cov149-Skeletonema_marinoi.AAC.3